MAFVQLDRRFREISPAHSAEDAAAESYSALVESREAGLGWQDLLGHRLVVVLGEPGSGKSIEFSRKAEELNGRGEFAFYLRLEDLVNNQLEQVISPADLDRLKRWARGQLKAIFFLDSVDEAKLRVSTDFGRALRRFHAAVGSRELLRASVLISSRITEWRPISDEQEVLSVLGLPLVKHASRRTDVVAVSDEAAEKLLVVQIEPLDKARARRMASALGVNDPVQFGAALDQQHAWIFARRPLDVTSLASYWLRHGQLGTLAELIEHDVTQKLAESEARERLDPLAPESARAGAEILAASALMCRKLTFRVANDPGRVDDGSALDASACLPASWTPLQVRALLARAVFDGESYGRIRFHHRQVLEYLAASWLNRRMSEGCGSRELKDLLLDTTRDPTQVRPNSASVASWLANGAEPWNAQVRQWIVRAAPWLHLRYGDPSALSVDYKRELLRALSARFNGRRRVWLDYDSEVLARLSHPDLAPEVSAMVRDRALAADLRSDMLAFVRHGRLHGCLDAALDVISANDEPEVLKHYAATALRDVADDGTLRRLHAIAAGQRSLESTLCGYLCEALYPRVITPAELCGLLEKVEHVPDHAVDLPWVLKRQIKEAAPSNDLARLAEALIALGRREPHAVKDKKDIPVSGRFHWVREVLPSLLRRLLAEEGTEASVSTCVDGLFFLADANQLDYRDRDTTRKLSDATFDRPQVRQAHFWRLVTQWRTERQKEPEWHFEVYDYFDILKPDSRDAPWLISDISTRLDERDRQFALRCAWGFTPALAAVRHWEIARRALSSPSTRRAYMDLVGQAIPLRVRRFFYRRRHSIGEAWWWQQRLYKVRRFRVWLRDQWYLHVGLNKLLSGKQQVWLAYLAREAATDANNKHWGTTDWEAVRRRRGPLIAWAAEQGCMRAWRNFRPELPHEKPNPNSTDLRAVMGLAGLNSAVARGRLNLATLSDDEARLAVRYSVNELNGFAPWMEALAKAKPAAVAAELASAIAGEWQFPAEREHVHEVIADLLWHGDEAANLAAPALLEQLEVRDPLHHTVLSQALAILLKRATNSYDRLERMASTRVANYPEDAPGFITWLAVWLQLNAGNALAFLEQHLATSQNPTSFMERLCGELRGERHMKTPQATRATYTEPMFLRRFLPLIFRHVDPAQDINRAGGGVYSPEARDHAQDFRDGLWNVLATSEHEDAEKCLKELAGDAAVASRRDWILHLIEERQAREADGAPWLPEDVRAFMRDYERDPANERELFAIAVRRLSDIKERLEEDDNSPRNELRADQVEGELRFWIARKLQEKSRDRYTIPQEEQVDQGHPDLRFHRPGLGPTSVEVKWANRCTAAELLERLENQLVGQYMRAANARFGIYVVGAIGTKRRWEHDGRRLAFNEVVAVLEQRAEQLSRTRPEIRGLRVISLDFVPAADRGAGDAEA